jgi:hypothetical protein
MGTIPKAPPLPFTVGDRVETLPHTDAWMQGDRYGRVVKVGRQLVHVVMDRSGRLRKFHPTRIGKVD